MEYNINTEPDKYYIERYRRLQKLNSFNQDKYFQFCKNLFNKQKYSIDSYEVFVKHENYTEISQYINEEVKISGITQYQILLTKPDLEDNSIQILLVINDSGLTMKYIKNDEETYILELEFPQFEILITSYFQ